MDIVLWAPSGARPPNAWADAYMVTQNQQQTTYLCRNWNSELWIRLLIIWINIGCLTTIEHPWLNLGRSEHQDIPRIAVHIRGHCLKILRIFLTCMSIRHWSQHSVVQSVMVVGVDVSMSWWDSNSNNISIGHDASNYTSRAPTAACFLIHFTVISFYSTSHFIPGVEKTMFF